jgi:hypothetical protein
MDSEAIIRLLIAPPGVSIQSGTVDLDLVFQCPVTGHCAGFQYQRYEIIMTGNGKSYTACRVWLIVIIADS